ncbi:MAG: Na+/H+ antiporter subunit D [Dehalococcoidia bacterium]|nr:Na+/H+ antiporter subunit D [Dehalococcoidia bacterium]
MDVLLILPLVIPLTTAAVSLLLRQQRHLQQFLGVAGMAALSGVAIVLLTVVWRDGIQTTNLGDWPAPFGIVLVADLLSSTMVLVAALMGLAVAVFSLASVEGERNAFGYYPLVHVLLMGVCGSFLTGDIFNLYVWFEVMLIASFALLSLGGERGQIEGTIKYTALNLFSSTVFLVAIGALYAVAGSLNMADIALALQGDVNEGLVTTIAVLFLIAFGIKAGAFPLYFWLPASYHTPLVAVSALFAGLLTKVGVYALIRVFTLLFVRDVGYTHNLILVVAGLTMVSGVLGAIAQVEYRRIVSFQIISTIGYMLMGLGLFTPLALAGAIFYVLQDIVVKTNLFLLGGVTQALNGTDRLSGLGGMYRKLGIGAACLVIPAFSLAGIPPLPGFFAKLALVQAGLREHEYLIVGVALAVGTLTLYSMAQVVAAWWKPTAAPSSDGSRGPARDTLSRQEKWSILGPVAVLSVSIVSMGLAAGPLFALAERAADQLLDPGQYIAAVLETSS